MKKRLLVLILLFSVPLLVNGQWVLDNFDAVPDSPYVDVYGNDDDNNTYLNLSLETGTVQEGTAALRIDWQNQCYDQWGGWIGINHLHPDTGDAYDYSIYTDISFWYYNEVKQSQFNQVEFRLILRDMGPGTIDDYDGANYEVWFSHHYILDNDPGWNKITVKMEDIGSQSGEGFWAPGWGQNVDGDNVLDLDKIKGWTMEFSQSSALYQQDNDSVSGVLILDLFQLEGAAPVNLVMFNGQGNPGNVNMHTGWSGSVEIAEDAGATEGTNAIKWSGGAAWDAVNFTFAQPRNMIFNWATDSVQFKIKADAGIGDLNLFFWDVDHDAEKEDYAFQATYGLTEAVMGYDGTWKQAKIALSDFNRFAGVWDNDLGASAAGEFDSTEVLGFAIGNMGQVIATDVYFDDVWTGSPEFDWVPPEAPENVAGIPAAGQYYNLVSWSRVPGEDGESYTIYASNNPITEIAPDMEIVEANVLGSEKTTVTHWLSYPLEDTDVTFYYAITCKDAPGNVGDPGITGAVTNMAKGVPTIAYDPGFSFAADGAFDEWTGAGIMPWVLTATENNWAAGEFDDTDDDLTATVYLAMDDDYLYVACDVIDDVFFYDASTIGSWWNNDAFEFFIGLWDQNGKPIHDTPPASNRGSEPDYKLIFLQDRIANEYRNGTDAEMEPADANYYYEEFGGADYAFEAKIPFDSIAVEGEDDIFQPENGMRLMFDLVFHDADADGAWDGNLTWSENNRDLAWNNQREWTFTWIGDTTHTVTAIEDKNVTRIDNFSLYQNYPNPFNPQTTIEYSLATSAAVKIVVYNTLGQEVVTLVNAKQNAGLHTVKFDGQNLTSGVYFFQLEAGDFVQTRKMLLVK